MAEVTPSDPNGTGGGAAVGGAILGGFTGLLVGVVLSTVGLSMSGGFSDAFSDNAPRTHAAGACLTGAVTATILLAIAAATAWTAWYMVFRNKSRTFFAGFLRGASTIVALFLLIPWPCSYTAIAFASFSACAR